MTSRMNETNKEARKIRVEYENSLRNLAAKKADNAKQIEVLKEQYLLNTDSIVEREHIQQKITALEEKIKGELEFLVVVETPAEDLTPEQIEILRIEVE